MQHHGYGAPHGQGQYGHPYPPPGYPPPPGYGHPPPPPGFGPPPPPPPGYSHDPEAYGHPSRADQREGRSEHREADYGHSNGYQRGEDGFGAGSSRGLREMCDLGSDRTRRSLQPHACWIMCYAGKSRRSGGKAMVGRRAKAGGCEATCLISEVRARLRRAAGSFCAPGEHRFEGLSGRGRSRSASSGSAPKKRSSCWVEGTVGSELRKGGRL